MAGQSNSIENKNLVMTYTLNNTATPCRPESLDSEVFSLLHLRLIVVRNYLYRFSAVDLIEVDRVATEVLDGFHCSRRALSGTISEKVLKILQGGERDKCVPGYTFPPTSTSYDSIVSCIAAPISPSRTSIPAS